MPYLKGIASNRLIESGLSEENTNNIEEIVHLESHLKVENHINIPKLQNLGLNVRFY
jgi:hypothetical protein